MLDLIADLCNKDYVKLIASMAEKETSLANAQAAYDISIQAVSSCKNRLFELCSSASITDQFYILTTVGILLRIDPSAKTIERVDKAGTAT